jgi:hypothetical protein
MKTRYRFVVLLLLLSSELIACQCAGKIPFEEDYSQSASIVTGRVISRQVKTYHYNKDGVNEKWTYFEYKIQVKQTYKGEPVKILWVTTARKTPACGMKFKIGKDYLIYAHHDERYGLYTSDCNRNFLSSDFRFEADLTVLNNKKKTEG